MFRALVLFLASCGRLGFEDVASRDGAGRDAAKDDARDSSGCVEPPLGVWNAPRAVAGLNVAGASDDDPSISANELELYFTSNRDGGPADLYRATRTDPTAAWGNVARVDQLSTADYENTPELSPDGLELYFVSDRPGSAGEDIWVARRASTDEAWGAPQLVVPLSSPAEDRAPSLFHDGLAMLFHSTRSGGLGSTDFWVTRRASRDAPWDPPQVLGAPNTAGTELRGWMSPCGLELYFQSSDRDTANMDFYVVRRASLDEPFGPATRIAELSDAAEYDQDLRLSRDRRRAWFASARGDGASDLFEASR